jgi:PncC family amidohydrolase
VNAENPATPPPHRATVVRMLGPGLAEVAAFAKTLSRHPGEVLSWDVPPEVHVKCPLPEQVAAMVARYGDAVYSVTGATLEATVAGLLTAAGLTAATAESCTGGMVAQMLTAVPGASACFVGGLVTYADAAKSALLDVPPALIAAHGAVSEPVVRAMAAGARRVTGADLAVAVSGIAGPGGGTPAKPVGTVWIGWEGPSDAGAGAYRFDGDREQVRRSAAVHALDALRRLALGMRGRQAGRGFDGR